MAIPTSSRRDSEPSSARLRMKITTITARLPINAASIGIYRAISPAAENGSTSQLATASAAPLLMPSRPGSASGLRNSPCITQPERASAAPTSRASSTRGRRMVSQIWRSMSSPEGSRLTSGKRMAPRVVANNVRETSSSVISSKRRARAGRIKATAPLCFAARLSPAVCAARSPAGPYRRSSAAVYDAPPGSAPGRAVSTARLRRPSL